MKKETVTATIYRPYDNSYFCEVVKKPDIVEFWIGCDEYGVKDYAFGIPAEDADTEEKILDFIERNFDEDVNIFIAEYVEE